MGTEPGDCIMVNGLGANCAQRVIGKAIDLELSEVVSVSVHCVILCELLLLISQIMRSFAMTRSNAPIDIV